MKKVYFLSIILLVFLSCKQEKKEYTPIITQSWVDQEIVFAQGFTIQHKETYKEIKITAPWPDAKSTFTYILYPKGMEQPNLDSPTKNTQFIKIPIDKTVVTSTKHEL